MKEILLSGLVLAVVSCSGPQKEPTACRPMSPAEKAKGSGLDYSPVIDHDHVPPENILEPVGVAQFMNLGDINCYDQNYVYISVSGRAWLENTAISVSPCPPQLPLLEPDNAIIRVTRTKAGFEAVIYGRIYRTSNANKDDTYRAAKCIPLRIAGVAPMPRITPAP